MEKNMKIQLTDSTIIPKTTVPIKRAVTPTRIPIAPAS